MKIIHLADLHFGKNMHGYSMIEMGDQPFWIEQFLKKIEEIKPDAIVIAGDVYDRAVPSKEAVRMLDGFLTEISKRKVPVLMIAGNHDSGTRLSFGEQLLCNQGVHIAGEVTKKVSSVTLQDEFGPVHFWLVPYIFPAAVQVILEREDIKDYDHAMKELLAEQSINYEERNVILSHQFVVCGTEKPTMGGSETTVGGIGQIDASLYEKFDYAALGHIHNAQRMGKETVRYAGSPLCYHFSESGQRKGLTVVELKEKGNIYITVEEMPVLHEFCEISGTLDELLLAQIKKNSYVRAILRQEVLPPQVVETLRRAVEEKQGILMEVARDFSYKKGNGEAFQGADIRNLSLEEMFTDFYRYQHDGELPDESISQLISFVAEQTRNAKEDTTEKERQQDMERLITFAGGEV